MDFQRLSSETRQNQKPTGQSDLSVNFMFLFQVTFTMSEVKPRDYCDADNYERRAEFVSEFQKIFPVVAE